MRIAICDDDAMCREKLSAVVGEYAAQKDLRISLRVCGYGAQLMEAAEKDGGFDIYLLDILMPGMDGVKLGVALREAGFDGKIIYLTSSEEYVFDSFRARPFDYLLKPVKKDVLFRTLDEALQSVSRRKEKGIIVKTKDSSVRLAFDSIMYAELKQKAVVYHLVDNRVVEGLSIRTSFSEAIQELLRDNRFAPCGASMVANLHYIISVESDTLVFKNGSRIYIGKRPCREVRSAWNDFWFDGEGSK